MDTVKMLAAGFSLLLLAGCQGDPGFPEDQRIDGPFEIGLEWQTITFADPLEINEEGFQRLHIVVDSELFASNFDYENEDRSNLFNLRRNDGVLVKPEVVLIGDNDQKVRLVPTGTTSLYTGGLTVGLSMFKDYVSPAPPFPKGIQHFEAVQLRSNEPFPAEYLQWWVERHPDHHRCGNRRCTWWDNLLQ